MCLDLSQIYNIFLNMPIRNVSFTFTLTLKLRLAMAAIAEGPAQEGLEPHKKINLYMLTCINIINLHIFDMKLQ